jgi:tetratricopeptide (TPR) repeat protein
LRKLPFVVIAAGFVAISLHFRGGQTAFTGDYAAWLLTPAQFMWYAAKALVPANLGIVYDWPAEPWTAWNIGAYVGLAAWAAAMVRWRASRLFVFGSLFFFGNLVLHTALATTFLGPYADRYGYLSVLGLWLAAWSLVPESKRTVVVRVGGAAAVVYAGLAFAQTQHWRSTIDLWTHNLTHESATFSNGMRGALYYESGQFARAQRDFEKVDRTPDPRFEPEKYSYLYTALGLMTTDTEPENSLRYFRQAAEWKPHPESFENVAVAAKKLGDFQTAEAFYLKCDKNFEPPSYFMNLSTLYFETQQFEKGADIMTQAIDAGCNDILCFKMRCFFRIESRDIPGALADFEQAMALFNAVPNAQPDPILNNLQMMLLPHLRGQ